MNSSAARSWLGAARGPALALLVLALLLAALELLGWAMDADSRCRDKLRTALFQISRSSEPITDQVELPWSSADVIKVRRPEGERGFGIRHLYHGKPVTADPGEVKQKDLLLSQLHDERRRLVFLVGGSAAFGFPYRAEQGLAARLQRRLGPGKYRVFNAAQPGWSSGQLAGVVRRIAPLKPHAVVVFLGNNEWFHWVSIPLSASQARALWTLKLATRSRFLSVIWHGLLTRKARVTRAEAVARTRRQSPPDWSGPPHLPPDHPAERLRLFTAEAWFATRQRFLHTLEQNLIEIIRVARRSGAQVYLLTMPFNYRLTHDYKGPQPDSFIPRHRAAVRLAVRRALQQLKQKQYKRCLDTVDRALALDPHPPGLHHLRGTCLERLGQLPAAQQAYAQSRDKVVGNLGSMLSVNASIRRAAARGGARLVDVKQLFDQHHRARGRYFNQDLIHDECHPTPAGHGLIARAVAARMGVAKAAPR